jgi:hypothetical protein
MQQRYKTIHMKSAHRSHIAEFLSCLEKRCRSFPQTRSTTIDLIILRSLTARLWPSGARVAVWVIPNIEHFLFDRPSSSIIQSTTSFVPDILNYSWRHFGSRVGIRRLMDIMQKHGIKCH